MSALVKQQQALALGHLYRSGRDSPPSIIKFGNRLAARQIRGSRRVGVPRQRWYQMVVQNCLDSFADSGDCRQALSQESRGALLEPCSPSRRTGQRGLGSQL
eukprot:7913902-Alexandrium_andersonii.AAC.1